jgi:hypothetical protein
MKQVPVEISEKKNQTPVRGQDGKIPDTRGKDFYWSPPRQSLVGDQKSKLISWFLKQIHNNLIFWT